MSVNRIIYNLIHRNYKHYIQQSHLA